jgi:membrane-associated phospholipid phosphatase
MLNSALPLNTCLGTVNPLAGPDHQIAWWFHAHLTHPFVTMLRCFSELGASESIGVVLSVVVVFFAFKRWWPSLVSLVIAVPGGMLLNEWVKLLVHRHRPFVDGWFVDWSGYSFASGHTIGATLLYGQLALFIIPAIKNRRWRVATIAGAVLFVCLVGFSRIALGAHYLSDVLAAICFGIVWLSVCGLLAKWLRGNSAETAVELLDEPVLAPAVQTLPIAPNE